MALSALEDCLFNRAHVAVLADQFFRLLFWKFLFSDGKGRRSESRLNVRIDSWPSRHGRKVQLSFASAISFEFLIQKLEASCALFFGADKEHWRFCHQRLDRQLTFLRSQMVFSYSLDDCGLFWYDGRAKARVSLPLDGVHVSARIVNMVAEVQIVQFYVNHTNLSIETSYTFPLDESAAVCGFEAELEDKLLIGEVREKEEARQEYNAAIARGETAALLEQNKPDMFVQTIGNIPPHSRINIRITYVADLKVIFLLIIFRLKRTGLSGSFFPPR